MLWRFTWEDRAVIIETALFDLSTSSTFNNKRLKIIFTRSKLPSTLLVNHESRHETLKYYKLMFHLPDHETRIYFRQGVDIPCFHIWDITKFQGCLDLAQVERLMIISRVGTFAYPKEYIYQVSKIDEPCSREWMGFRLGHKLDDVIAACPSVQWLYWLNEHRDINPKHLRILMTQKQKVLNET